jgi:hypothetical protein
MAAPAGPLIGAVKAGTNISISADGTISASSPGGTITGVTPGFGILGGGTTGNVTISANTNDLVTIGSTQVIDGFKTFTTALVASDGTNGVELQPNTGAIKVTRPAGGYIDFRNNLAEDYVARIDNFAGGYIGFTNPTGNCNISVQGDIVAFVSDMRLKTNIESIDNALDKVKSLRGFTYTMNEKGQSLGYDADTRYPGVSAQEVQAVLPEAVKIAPASEALGEEHLTVQYEKLVPLLIEAIKEISYELNALKEKL